VIFVLGSLISLIATIGAAKANSYGGYMAARFFQGLGVSPAATVGLAIINEFVAPVNIRPARYFPQSLCQVYRSSVFPQNGC
jgi:MFS family permease